MKKAKTKNFINDDVYESLEIRAAFKKILDFANLIFAILSLPILFLFIIEIHTKGFNCFFLFRVVTVVIFWTLYFLRKKISINFQAITIIATLMLMVIPSIPLFGIKGLYGYTTIMAAVLAVIFYGKKWGMLIAIFGSFYTLIFGYIFIVSDWHDLIVSISSYRIDFIFHKALGTLFATTVVVFLIDYFRDFFINSYRNLAETNSKLTEAEFKSRFLADIASEGIVIHEKGIAIDMNNSFLKMFGYTKEELIGKNLVSLLIPEKYRKITIEKIGKGHTSPYEIEVIKKDGTIFPAEIEGRNIKNNLGETVRVAAVRDLSEYKKHIKQIRQLSTAAMQSPNSLVITDTDGNIEFVNDTFTKITGYSLEESIGKNPRILKSGIHPKEFYEELWKTIKSGKVWRGEFYNKRKDNTFYWEKASISPVVNNEGKIINYLAIKEDITEKKKAEEILQRQREQLELSNARLESLLRISEQATKSVHELFQISLKEAVLLTNSEVGFIMNYDEKTKKMVFNSCFGEIFVPEQIECKSKVFDLDKTKLLGEAIRQKKAIIINDYKKSNISKKGLPKEHTNIKNYLEAPIFVDNKIVGVVAVANKEGKYDHSDERQVTLLMDSVWKIAERVSLIEELKTAKEKAEEANRLKSAFLASMSHEIRTPLNSIVGFSNIIAEEAENDDLIEYSTVIKKESDLLLNLVNDILEFSKIEAGVLEIHNRTFNLNDVIDDVYNTFKNKVQPGIDFIPTKIGDKLLVASDDMRLKQIFINFISNSLKFTSEGKIAFGFKLDENSEIIGFVEDTGIGIPVDKQKEIFERFKKLNKYVPGTGLGLSIVKAIIELMKGKVWLKSEPGKGTTFYFKIPFIEKENGNKKDKNKEASEEKTNLPSGKTILVAEDDENNFLYMKKLLVKKGINIIRATNGKEAVDICKKRKDISLVLMDIKMPELDGYKATKKIKEMFPQLPVVAQTAYASNDDREKAIDSGCDDYITKPIDKEELFDLLKEWDILQNKNNE